MENIWLKDLGINVDDYSPEKEKEKENKKKDKVSKAPKKPKQKVTKLLKLYIPYTKKPSESKFFLHNIVLVKK